MRILLLLVCSLALFSSGCNRNDSSIPLSQKKSDEEPQGIMAPEDIRRPDGTLKYRVRRVTSSSIRGTQREIHEVDFYSEDGKRIQCTQNYVLGALTPQVSLEWRYDANGRRIETWHYRFSDQTLSKVEYLDDEGKVRHTEEHDAAEQILVVLPVELW